MKKRVQKLSLNKDTLRTLESNLSEQELAEVIAGISCTCSPRTLCPCSETCRGDCC